MRILRRLYDWTLSWAERPGGLAALAGFAFAEASFFPIPPDPLLMALCLGKPRRGWRFAGICTAASMLGGLAGYGIGYGLFEAIGRPILNFYGMMGLYHRIAGAYARHAWWIIFLAAFTPIPYKAITITAGVAGVPLAPFMVFSVLGRGGRFFLVAGMLRLWGKRIREFIERRFNLLTVAFGILAVAGVTALGLFR